MKDMLKMISEKQSKGPKTKNYMINVNCYTWINNSHGLFDYESDNFYKKCFKIKCLYNFYYVLKDDINVEVLNEEEIHKVNTVNTNLKLICKIKYINNNYQLIPCIQNTQSEVHESVNDQTDNAGNENSDENENDNFWVIVKYLKNKSSILHENDVIKLGRVKLRIKKIITDVQQEKEYNKLLSPFDEAECETVAPENEIGIIPMISEVTNEFSRTSLRSIHDSIHCENHALDREVCMNYNEMNRAALQERNVESLHQATPHSSSMPFFKRNSNSECGSCMRNQEENGRETRKFQEGSRYENKEDEEQAGNKDVDRENGNLNYTSFIQSVGIHERSSKENNKNETGILQKKHEGNMFNTTIGRNNASSSYSSGNNYLRNKKNHDDKKIKAKENSGEEEVEEGVVVRRRSSSVLHDNEDGRNNKIKNNNTHKRKSIVNKSIPLEQCALFVEEKEKQSEKKEKLKEGSVERSSIDDKHNSSKEDQLHNEKTKEGCEKRIKRNHSVICPYQHNNGEEEYDEYMNNEYEEEECEQEEEEIKEEFNADESNEKGRNFLLFDSLNLLNKMSNSRCSKKRNNFGNDPEKNEERTKISFNNIIDHQFMKYKRSYSTTSSMYNCRICLCEYDDQSNPLISPCKCKGSMKYVHLKCLRTWMNGRLNMKSQSSSISFFWKQLNCELCKCPYPTYIYVQNRYLELYEIPKPELPYVIIEVINDKNKGFYIVSLAKAKLARMGRGHDCEVRVNDISVSRFHAMLKFYNGKFYVEDCKSKFGTLIQIRKPVFFNIKKNKFIALQIGRTVMYVYMKRRNWIFLPVCLKLSKTKDEDVSMLDNFSSKLLLNNTNTNNENNNNNSNNENNNNNNNNENNNNSENNNNNNNNNNNENNNSNNNNNNNSNNEPITIINEEQQNRINNDVSSLNKLNQIIECVNNHVMNQERENNNNVQNEQENYNSQTNNRNSKEGEQQQLACIQDERKN